MSICRRLQYNFDYALNSVTLDRVNEFNDLGIIVESDLSWHKHIQAKISKASQMLGLIRRGIGYHAPCKVKRLFYLSLVQPTLSYGSVVWYPNKEDLVRLESVQRRATKYISNDYVSCYKSRLNTLKLLPFSFLRETFDLSFIYKCLNKHHDMDVNRYITIYDASRSVTRRGQNGVLFTYPLLRTERAHSSYFSRIVPLWNSLPHSIRSVTSMNKFARPFRDMLLKWYTTNTNINFDVSNTCTWVTHCRCHNCRPV